MSHSFHSIERLPLLCIYKVQAVKELHCKYLIGYRAILKRFLKFNGVHVKLLQVLILNLIINKEKQEIINIPNGPRRAYVAQFRLSTGHDCLGKHLHRFGIKHQPACYAIPMTTWTDSISSHAQLYSAQQKKCDIGKQNLK